MWVDGQLADEILYFLIVLYGNFRFVHGTKITRTCFFNFYESLKLIKMFLKCFVNDSEMLFNNFEKLSNDFEMFFNDFFDDLSTSLNNL